MKSLITALAVTSALLFGFDGVAQTNPLQAPFSLSLAVGSPPKADIYSIVDPYFPEASLDPCIENSMPGFVGNSHWDVVTCSPGLPRGTFPELQPLVFPETPVIDTSSADWFVPLFNSLSQNSWNYPTAYEFAPGDLFLDSPTSHMEEFFTWYSNEHMMQGSR